MMEKFEEKKWKNAVEKSGKKIKKRFEKMEKFEEKKLKNLKGGEKKSGRNGVGKK